MTKEEFRSAMMQRKMSVDLLLKFPIVARDAFPTLEDLRLDVVRVKQISKWFQYALGFEAAKVKIYARADNGKNLQKRGMTNLVFEAENLTYKVPIRLKEDFYVGATNIQHWYIPTKELLNDMETTMYKDLQQMQEDCMRCMRKLDCYLGIIKETEQVIADCISKVPSVICPEFIVKHKQVFDDAY